MAHQLSPNMTLIAASPGGIAETSLGRTRTVRDSGTKALTYVEDDTVALIRVPPHAVLDEFFWMCDDLGGTVALDFGFWRAGQGAAIGAAIDPNGLATLVDCASAVAKTDLRYEVLAIETTGQEVWELAGLSARPDYDIDIGFVATTGTTPLVGDIAWLINYHV